VGTFNSAPGSSVCTPCGAGTTPNKDKVRPPGSVALKSSFHKAYYSFALGRATAQGATECVNTCTFSSGVTDTTTNIAGNYTFDLTALKQYVARATTLTICGT
jgi:hypothetical protein